MCRRAIFLLPTPRIRKDHPESLCLTLLLCVLILFTFEFYSVIRSVKQGSRIWCPYFDNLVRYRFKLGIIGNATCRRFPATSRRNIRSVENTTDHFGDFRIGHCSMIACAHNSALYLTAGQCQFTIPGTGQMCLFWFDYCWFWCTIILL